MVLNEELQYIGRSSPVGCPSGYEYYILAYAGAVEEGAGHRIRVCTRLACTADASFYGFTTSGSAYAGGLPVYGWTRRQIPESYWGDSPSLTEGGVTYPRWTELAEGEVFLDSFPAGGELLLEVSWVMESSYEKGWFPNTAQKALGSFPVTLSPIAAAAEPVLSAHTVAADGQTTLFVTLRPSSDAFVHRVDCLMGAVLMERREGVTGCCEFTFDPEGWLPYIPDRPDTLHLAAESAPRIRVTTADTLGNVLGQREARFDITAPSRYAPTVTLDALTPVSLLPVPFDGVYLQNLSSVKAAFTAVGQYGATVTDSWITVEGKRCGSEKNHTSQPFTQWGDTVVKVFATDSRGFTGFAEGKIHVYPYTRPVLHLEQWGRCDGDGNFIDDGERLKLTASGSCCALPLGENLCGLEIRWKKKGEVFGDWTVLAPMTDTAAVFDGIPEEILLDPQSSYVLRLRCRDTVGGCTETEITVSARRIYMHRTSNAMGLGKYVEEDGLLDCGWNVWLRGSVRLGEAGVTLEEYIRNMIAGG